MLKKIQYEGEISKIAIFNNFIFVGSIKGNVNIYSLSSLDEVTQFLNTPNPTKITSMCLCGEKLFVGDSSGVIKVWKFSDDKIEKITGNLGGHDSFVTRMIEKDGNLYTFGMDNKFSIWNIEALSRTKTISEIHKDGILSAEFIGNKLVTSGGDLLVKIQFP